MNLHIQVSTGKNDTRVVRWAANVLHVRLAAAPIEGQANDALIHFLADQFNLAPSNISLIKGHTSKHKTVVLPLVQEQFDSKLKTILSQKNS